MIRRDFPILDSIINGNKLVYLDSGATSHKPQIVIDTMCDFMSYHYGTVRRGVYDLSINSTQAFDQAREKIRNFINAKSNQEVIFTRGTTESINMVAFCLCEALRGISSPYSTSGEKSKLHTDKPFEILVSEMEHHANLIPWQIQAHRLNIPLKFIPVLENGELDLKYCEEELSSGRIKILTLTHLSNVLGTINPIKEIIKLAHENNVIVLIDGAQAVSHMQIDVQDLDCDFYVFSGHKLYGPTGVGVLYGKKDLLDLLPPYHGGGEMIETAKLERTTYAGLPFKFEAGTPPILEVIGLGAAIDYVSNIGFKAISNHENCLLEKCTLELLKINKLKIIGQAKQKTSLISFVFDDIEAFDIGTMLNQHGIAIRTGHHCAQPLMQRFNLSSTSRVSLALYNNEDDIDRFIEVLKIVIKLFR